MSTVSSQLLWGTLETSSQYSKQKSYTGYDKRLAPLSIQRALHPPQFLWLDRPPWQGPVSFRETVHDHCTSGLPISEGADVSLACSRAIRTVDVVQCSFQCILAVNEKLHKKRMCMQYNQTLSLLWSNHLMLLHSYIQQSSESRLISVFRCNYTIGEAAQCGIHNSDIF